MRLPFAALVALLSTIVLGPTVIVARLFGVPMGEDSIYARCVRLWARWINWAAGVRVRVHGAENRRGIRGAVYTANHVSWFDIFTLAATVPWCSFVAKASLRRIPVFGLAAELVGIVFIDRDNRKQAFESYRGAAEEIRRGRSMIVCPEGTRGLDYHLRPFKKGPFVLAIESGTPVVPTIVYGAREVMPKGSFWVRSGTVDIHFLEPVHTETLTYDDRHELMSTVWTRMADAMRELYGVGTAEHPIATEGVRSE